jgi:NitT/TauT family transport system substrate-binding protein
VEIQQVTLFTASRRSFVAGIAAAGFAAQARPLGAAVKLGPLERTSLRVATAVDALTFLPIYIAAARTWKEQGLDVQLFGFRGEAEALQALAGDSVDITLESVPGVIEAVKAGQPIRAFYAGFRQADFSWISGPSIKTWEDLRGKNVGVSTIGSLTDLLTRFALRRHKLEPEKDVNIVQIGSTQSSLAAIRSGRLAAGILSPPYTWQATGDGLNMLGTQAKEVSSSWPKHVFLAKTALLKDAPNTMKAFLRSHVSAIRLAKSDRDFALKTLVDKLKLTPDDALRAYNIELPGFDERGELPKDAMPTFWKIAMSNGDVDSPWPESKFLDRRYIDTFREWAP